MALDRFASWTNSNVSSACGSDDPKPSACGASYAKASACGSDDPKPSACGVSDRR